MKITQGHSIQIKRYFDFIWGIGTYGIEQAKKNDKNGLLLSNCDFLNLMRAFEAIKKKTDRRRLKQFTF